MTERGILFFDGAMGSMLQARGLKLRELPESLNFTHPDLIKSIHKEYLDAGSNFVSTNTFGANRFKLFKANISVEDAIGAAIKIARDAVSEAGHGCVALDIGPTGRVMMPYGDASFDEIYDAVAEQVRAGVKAGLDARRGDVILLETFTDLKELKASVLAVKENCDLKIFATMSFEESGRTFFGTSVESMVLTLEGLGVSALGVNCSLGPLQLEPIVKKICGLSHIDVIVQPNAGLPVMRDGKSSYDVTPDEFAKYAAKFANIGVSYLGGCCGTTPEHIGKMINAVRAENNFVKRSVNDLTAVCSGSKSVIFDDDFIIIGERLNPTGKKLLQAALRAGDMDYIMREALTQQDQGADILDVNVGLPDIDEADMLSRAVSEIQGVCDLPIQIDSSSYKALEAAARVYTGKPLINSVSGKAESLNNILPIAKKYGACVLGLTLDDNGIAETAEARLKVAEKIVLEAEKFGIARRNILIDCLTLAASAQQELVRETLKAIRLIKDELGVKVTLGISNVSFGLPERKLLNRVMLAAALAQGLDGAIMNPADAGMRETIAAWRLLNNIDKDAKDYIAYCAENFSNDNNKAASAEKVSANDIKSAVIKGLKDEAAGSAKILLRELEPLKVIEEHIVPALDAVGVEYEQGKIFLPQLLQSADAAKAAFACVREAMINKAESKSDSKAGRIIIATVYGDVHDIGKNIVKVILENYNFEDLHLGRDVPADKVIEA
ncbi:MAG: homocysteine S-methyltransferase family protein, partial [Synergistaceae bacterium]|nr:homocysteine S-methyltransferase family protein [Synergistaceae bacterium]